MSRAGIRETRELLSRGEVSVVDHVHAQLAAVHATDPELGAFVHVADEQALRDAEAADARIRALGRGAWASQPLLGVTVAVKDLVQTRDLPTTRGSRLPNRRPRVDAPAVARLRAAGAVVVGKTTTSEFGWSATTVGRLGPATRNPWARDRSAGGSSGGSAAAVAAGLATVALGTDGAGSVRIPAAFCGVVGFKPSFGRVPYVPACADRLAHLGPITGSVSDAAEVLSVISGPDRQDPDSGLGTVDPSRDRRRLRIGCVEFPGTSPEVGRVVERALPALAGRGYRLERLEVPFVDPYPALLDILAAGEAAATTPHDEPECDPGRLAVVRYGRSLTGADLAVAEEVRMALRTRLRTVMDRYDLLVTATVPIEPFDVDALGPDWAADPEALRWLAWTPATYPFNLTGQPALSVPVGLTRSGLPVGLQLVGPVGADALVLSVGRHLEAELEPLPVAPVRVTERML